jgi:hypothetical protein
MTTDAPVATHALPGPTDDLLGKLEAIYRDIHANPELSMQEHRTSGIVAAWLREQGYDVTEGVGGTGVVGLLRNGDGPVVLLRADMDALPIKESPGLAYASDKTGTDRFGQATSIRPFLRARYARRLADGRDAHSSRESEYVARNGDGRIPAR